MKLSFIDKSIIFLAKMPDKKNERKMKLWLNNIVNDSSTKDSKLKKQLNL